MCIMSAIFAVVNRRYSNNMASMVLQFTSDFDMEGRPGRGASSRLLSPSLNFLCHSKTRVFDKALSPYASCIIFSVSVPDFFRRTQNRIDAHCYKLKSMLGHWKTSLQNGFLWQTEQRKDIFAHITASVKFRPLHYHGWWIFAHAHLNRKKKSVIFL